MKASEEYRQHQLELYRSIMEEARTRVDAINVVLRGATGLAERAAAEFCFLQIRMLCELTALGCLVANARQCALEVLANTSPWLYRSTTAYGVGPGEPRAGRSGSRLDRRAVARSSPVRAAERGAQPALAASLRYPSQRLIRSTRKRSQFGRVHYRACPSLGPKGRQSD